MAATKRRRRAGKRTCLRYGYKTEIQDYGPAKRRRVCKRWGGSGKTRSKWCIYKGKKRGAESCHRKKSTANRAARVLQKRCKAKIKVKAA